jgi:hypothetical protein
VDLSARLTRLRLTLGRLRDPSPELLNLVGRLDGLLTKVQGSCAVTTGELQTDHE